MTNLAKKKNGHGAYIYTEVSPCTLFEEDDDIIY